MSTIGVVLAAGEGRRFRASAADGPAVKPDLGHKLLVEFRGRPLATWAVEAALLSSLDRVLLVTGSADLSPVLAWLEANRPQISLAKLEVVHNDRWQEGQATSVSLGLQRAGAAGCQAVVVGLADQPLVPPEAWTAVAEAPGLIAVATFNGLRRPPVKLDRAVWGLVPTVGDSGARTLIRMRPELVSEVTCSGNPIDVDTVKDLYTVKDLRAWS